METLWVELHCNTKGDEKISFKEYVDRIANVLQTTLALSRGEVAGKYGSKHETRRKRLGGSEGTREWASRRG